MKYRRSRNWDDISYIKNAGVRVDIDDRTNNLIHLSNGTMKYDYDRFNSFWDAIKQDWIENPTDDQLFESISICFSEKSDRLEVFQKLKMEFCNL